jgi:phosphate-selective porin OprO/OprP
VTFRSPLTPCIGAVILPLRGWMQSTHDRRRGEALEQRSFTVPAHYFAKVRRSSLRSPDREPSLPDVRVLPALALLALASTLSPLEAFGQEEPTLEDIDARLRLLERKTEIPDEEAASKARRSSSAAAGDKGFSLESADGSYELKLRALVQGDARFFVDDSVPRFNDTFILRRLRPTFEGSLGKLIGFRLTPEFAGASATIVDAYLDLKFHPAAVVRVGKQKGPVGLERLQSGGSLTFIERAFPTELAPNRDIGVTLQGELASSTVTYAVGVYNGVADGRDARATDVDDRKEVAARLFFEPFRNDPGFLRGLGFGMAGSTGRKQGTTVGTEGVLPQYRSPGQNTFFQYVTGVAANGTHQRLTAHGYLYRHSLGLLGEYIESQQELQLGTVESEFTHTAWQLTGSYVLTGEDASYRGVVKPNRPFEIGGAGWGALELALRVSELDVDDEAFPVFASPLTHASKATAYGIGVNWYLTANAKIVATYTHTEFEGGGITVGVPDRENERAVFARLQVSY